MKPSDMSDQKKLAIGHVRPSFRKVPSDMSDPNQFPSDILSDLAKIVISGPAHELWEKREGDTF